MLVPVAFERFLLTDDYLLANPCAGVLAPGASCTVRVTFFATTRGARPGELDIRSHAKGSPHVVELSGVACSIPTVVRSRLGVPLCAP